MAINVEWQNERGEPLARYSGPWLRRGFCKAKSGGAVCLRFIDPYGNTIFNQGQIPVLEQELVTLSKAANDPELNPIYEGLIEFIRLNKGKPHLYLKFIGD